VAAPGSVGNRPVRQGQCASQPVGASLHNAADYPASGLRRVSIDIKHVPSPVTGCCRCLEGEGVACPDDCRRQSGNCPAGRFSTRVRQGLDPFQPSRMVVDEERAGHDRRMPGCCLPDEAGPRCCNRCQHLVAFVDRLRARVRYKFPRSRSHGSTDRVAACAGGEDQSIRPGPDGVSARRASPGRGRRVGERN
jgi:hypothetical protein